LNATPHNAHGETSLNRSAFQATTHCLTGCAIGEVLGMVIATALGWGNVASIAIAIALAFFFGYLLTLGPVLRANVPVRRAVGLTFASDTLSIMEIVDNAFILIVPGAIAAELSDALFWWSLAVSLVIAFIARFRPIAGSSLAVAVMRSYIKCTNTDAAQRCRCRCRLTATPPPPSLQ
jgi:Domain of unknown function (DUF4396)